MPRSKVIYSFDPRNEPAEYVEAGEKLLLQTEDAFGGQISTERDSVTDIDWTKVDGATGPIFIEDAKPGDTLTVEILDIRTEQSGVIVTVPKYGILSEKRFRPTAKKVELHGGYVHFDEVARIKMNPMIGTIGVTPEKGRIPTGSLGNHGGNIDTKEVAVGTKLHLPVFVDGALFAAGDMHAVQADGELCVSAVEVAGEAVLEFSLTKNKKPKWPILETSRSYAVLACGDSLDEAAKFAAEAAIEAIRRHYGWSFEKAYAFGSLVVDLEINQVVDLKRGVRAVISKDFLALDSLLT